MKIAILKISGKALTSILEESKWIGSIKNVQNFFDGVVIIHGAGNDITQWAEMLGHESKFINGMRVTTKEMMDIVAAVQGGITNAKLVGKLNSLGLNAVGLTGIDGNSYIAEYADKNLGFVGFPKQKQSVDWINELLNKKVMPVFSSICRDENGNLMNVNADLFTEVLATSLNADSVFFLSDVSGVKLNGSFQPCLNPHQIIKGITDGEITDGMIPKLQSCLELLNKGIKKIWIGSFNSENLFNDISFEKSNGTWIIQSA